MAANLAAAGHSLVLFNRTRQKADELARRLSCDVAASPREAAQHADVIVTMLADATALQKVVDGPDGVLAGAPSGAVLIDMGTTGPAAIERLQAQAAGAGVKLVDAPVSGSTAAAEAADLTIMVGAPTEVFETVEPILGAMGSTTYHVGDTGAGSVVKLAVNNIIFSLGNAISESLVIAERAGLRREAVYEVFENSAVAAPMVSYRHDAFLVPEETPPAFALVLAEKDLRLITELAARLGVPVEQATANRRLVEAAVAAGLGDHDMADVAVHLRRAASR
jgi:3-hydroxyisobutyrate dehydrogenase-like beta-hydroxyacid dehydrogenase